MLIGVISDTHGDHGAIERAVTAAGTVDMWLHGGDYSQDSHYITKITGLPVIAVRGNCDGYPDAKVDEYIDVGAVKIWLTHGNRFSCFTCPGRAGAGLVGSIGGYCGVGTAVAHLG